MERRSNALQTLAVLADSICFMIKACCPDLHLLLDHDKTNTAVGSIHEHIIDIVEAICQDIPL